jgi:hypothetical protein
VWDNHNSPFPRVLGCHQEYETFREYMEDKIPELKARMRKQRRLDNYQSLVQGQPVAQPTKGTSKARP